MASSTESGADDGETRAPLVDAVETAAVVAIPAVALAVATTSIGDGPVVGLVAGAIVGSLFGAVRRSMYAVRTAEGIVRRPRPAGDGAPGRLARLVDAEPNPRVGLAIGLVCWLVGVGSLAGIVLVAEDPGTALRLGALALFGLVTFLGAVGAYALRT